MSAAFESSVREICATEDGDAAVRSRDGRGQAYGETHRRLDSESHLFAGRNRGRFKISEKMPSLLYCNCVEIGDDHSTDDFWVDRCDEFLVGH